MGLFKICSISREIPKSLKNTIKMMNSFSKLLCGNYDDLAELSQILALLDSTIENFSNRCFTFLEESSNEDIATLGAYCGRTLLEASCIALIGRVTPYRLLLLKRYQEQPNYDLGIRHKISIEWKGDVLPKSQVEKEKLWTEKEISNKDSTSPLLSDYMWHIHWMPAFKSLLDDTEDDNYETLIQLKNIPIEGICQNLRREAEEVYSSLSKGIHQEFIIPHHVAYDSSTVMDLLQRTIKLITKLALISHYIPTAIASIDKSQMLSYLAEIEEKLSV
jgi:hypothetical protein